MRCRDACFHGRKLQSSLMYTHYIRIRRLAEGPIRRALVGYRRKLLPICERSRSRGRFARYANAHFQRI
jgi:hypothetical protein